MHVSSSVAIGNYKPFVEETQRTLPSSLDGAANSEVTVRRDSFTGIVTIENFISPAGGNLSTVYFFEKEDSGQGESTHLFLIDVCSDPGINPALGSMNLQAFLDNAAANINDFKLQQAVRDQTNEKILTEYKSRQPVDVALFDAARRIRIVRWTSDFQCVVDVPPVVVPVED